MLYFATESVRLATGSTVYVSIEEVDDDTLHYWRWYLDSAEFFLTEVLTPFLKQNTCLAGAQHPFWIDQQNRYFDEMLTPLQHAQMKEYMVSRAAELSQEKSGNLIKGLRDGLTGFHYALPQEGVASKNRYVVYVTKNPRKMPMSSDLVDMPAQFRQPYGFACYTMQEDTPKIIAAFMHRYYDLIISMAAVTTQDSDSVCYMGIFKNPRLLVSSENQQYANLSILLHSFAAKVFSTAFNKTLQIHQPTEFMRHKLHATLQADDITEQAEPVAGENHCPVREGGVTVVQLSALAQIFEQNKFDGLRPAV